jgi:hypothetical protein
MATTTNYGWTTPDDTALVKDGAAAIRTLGSSVDSTVFANASAAIPKTIVDAKGDLIAATAADTVARLSVGSNDQVLTADSTAATGMKWATVASGGMALLSTTTLSGTSITISSINQNYNELLILLIDTVNASSGRLAVAANNSTTRCGGFDSVTGTAYQSGQLHGTNQTSASAMIRITNYASTTQRKNGISSVGFSGNSGGAVGSYYVDQTAAVTSLVITNSAGGNFTAGTVLIYGVK